MEKHRDHLEGPQLFSVHSKPSISMVRTRGSAAGAKGGDGHVAEQGRNNNAGAESPDPHSQNRVSFYGVAAMPVYREGTPPPDEEEDQHNSSSCSALHPSYNFQQSEAELLGAEQRQPPSPMVTPPVGGYHAEASMHTKKSPPGSSAGVPHIYHDYSQVPDESNYVRKKTGGVSEYILFLFLCLIPIQSHLAH